MFFQTGINETRVLFQMMSKENSNEPPSDKEKIKMYKDGLENETQLHWKRNSYFLVSSSILLVVLGLVKNENFHVVLGVLGVILNVVWLLIQDRSSRYVGYWKKEISKLRENIDDFDIYPKKLKGVQMRHLGYILPLPFILIWLAVICIALHPDYSLIETVQSVLPNTTG